MGIFKNLLGVAVNVLVPKANPIVLWADVGRSILII